MKFSVSRHFHVHLRSLLPFYLVNLCLIKPAFSYKVDDLVAQSKNGQVFITWTNPNATNLQYNVYRSLLPLTSSTQLGSSAFLGFVRDNSSKNLFWTDQTNEDVFYKIGDSGQPLSEDQGLYVVTSTSTLTYFY